MAGRGEELGVNEGSCSICGEMCRVSQGRQPEPQRAGPWARLTPPRRLKKAKVFVRGVFLQCFGRDQWWEAEPEAPQQDVGRGGRLASAQEQEEEERSRALGADEPRGTEARKLSASAEHRGHPELLEQHISSLPQLKSVLSVLR